MMFRLQKLLHILLQILALERESEYFLTCLKNDAWCHGERGEKFKKLRIKYQWQENLDKLF